MAKVREIVPGDRFGHWVVQSFAGSKLPSKNAPSKCKYYLCKCDCGTVREVKASDLRRGVTESCGCLKGERRWHKEIKWEPKVTEIKAKPYKPEHPEMFTDDWMFNSDRIYDV